MIVVDASALLAVILKEPDWERFALVMSESDSSQMSVTSGFECASKLQRVGGDELEATLEIAIDAYELELVPAGIEHLKLARQAFRQFGKGLGHPARLNFGDCFSYALARSSDAPLLFKGNDFIHTDITPALT